MIRKVKLVWPFRSELERLGWISGRNLEIEYCWGAPNAETQARFAKQLTAKGLDAILTHTTVSSVAMKNETSSVPIVFVQVSDPVNSRLVVSLSRPEGNVTGFTETGADTMTGKWLGLLKEIAPETKRVVAMTSVPGASDFFVRTVTEAASLLGVEPIIVPVEKVADFEPLIASQARNPSTGLLITPDSFLTFYRAEITSLAARYRLPAVYPFRYFATIGGLLSYGSDPLDIMRRAGGYIDRILRGEKPSDLPVQNPVQIEMLIVRCKPDKPHWGAPKIRERLARLYPDVHTPATRCRRSSAAQARARRPRQPAEAATPPSNYFLCRDPGAGFAPS